jgi:autoinducer 2-degrading protein
MLKGFIIVPSEDLNAVLAELPIHIENTKEEIGCLIFQVLQDQAQLNRFSVHEEFIDKASFEAHQDRVKNSKWGRVSSNIERHYRVNKIG